MRCPVCFNRDIDVLMKLENGRYSCLKCSFSGTPLEIRDRYKDIQKKFKWIEKRVTVEEYDRI
jgi:hypothetical protein